MIQVLRVNAVPHGGGKMSCMENHEGQPIELPNKGALGVFRQLLAKRYDAVIYFRYAEK